MRRNGARSRRWRAGSPESRGYEECAPFVDRAVRVMDPVFLDSPQFVCEPLGEELGVRLAIKVETLNPIRSFKGRGTEFLV